MIDSLILVAEHTEGAEMSGSGPDEMRRRIDDWAAQAQAKAQAYKALTEDLDKITATAESANGAIRVTVNRAGVITALEISDDVRGMRGHQLSADIMKAARRAQATLGEQVVRVMQEKVPQDSASIAAIADSYARQFPLPEQNQPAAVQQADDDEDLSGQSFLR